ncbi:MAG TPA: response regulator [Verrucomicrobiae bacterium]|nr:response regulator [Verrucomicrobiae bacterium]
MKKILIVEDDLIVRSIYRRKFEMSGYKVETAEEGGAALALMPTFKPHVVQVDIMMPGIDGVEVIRKIRAWPDFKHTPILVLSSFYRPDLAKEAWKAGANKCVSKMDCTPNLALDLVEQLLADENSGYSESYGEIALAKNAFEVPVDLVPPENPAIPDKSETDEEQKSGSVVENAMPSVPSNPELAKLRLTMESPPVSDYSPPPPPPPVEKSSAPPEDSKPKYFGGELPAPYRPAVRPSFGTPPPPPPKPAPVVAAVVVEPPAPLPPPPPVPATPEVKPASDQPATGSDFRVEIRQEFLRRAPQIQSELRDRVNAMIKSKSTSDQLNLLRQLEVCVESMASLSGITGFGRISHLSGALDALVQELLKKPSQMTASVLRTIAHASDCLDVLFRDLGGLSKDIPQSVLILAVDDEPISRRTISIALSKASLRSVGLEDPQMALTILKENQFDLIFLDADMPVMSGFELCTELRKLPTNKTTPVIFVTALTNFEVRAQSSLSGGNDIIAKPFLMMELAVKALTYLLKPSGSVEARTRS